MRDFNVNIPVEIPQDQMITSLIKWLGLDYLLGEEKVEIKPKGDDLLYKMPSEPESAWKKMPKEDHELIVALNVIINRLVGEN